MKQGGLKRIHIVIIGIVLGVVMAAGVFFALVQPDKAEIENVNGAISGYNDTIAKKPQAEKAIKQAEIDKTAKTVALAKYEMSYMRLGPERAFLSMKDPQKAMILLWKEQNQVMGPLITRYIQKSGVRLLTPLQIPGAPSDPNQINANEYTVPLGQIQVAGTFGQINNFLLSLGRSPRLIRVNNVELAGESPNITATMDLTVIILPRDSKDAKPVPTATDTSAGTGATSYGPINPGGPSSAGPYGPGAPPPTVPLSPGGSNGPS
jgi:Tfp pilus assembly protein PilO